VTDRRRFLGGLALSVLAAPLVAKAQQAAKVSRIGYLSSHSPETFRIEAFRQGLHEFGWVEGRNLIIEYRSADGKFDRIPVLAAELVRLKVDVIVAVPTVSALAAKRVTQTIPIVFTHVSDPIGSGLVPTLARPGGNVTGFTHVNVGLTPKRLEFLKETIPNISRMVAPGILVVSASAPKRSCWRRLRPRPGHWGSSFNSSKCGVPAISTGRSGP